MTGLAPGTYVHGSGRARETTQWEDILVSRGIVAEDPSVARRRAEAEEAAKRGEVQAPSLVERAVSEGVDAVEDEARRDDGEEQVLAMLREARRRQLREEAARARFGTVERIARDEFVDRVKRKSEVGGEGGGSMYVVLELFKGYLEHSQLVSRALDRLALANPDVCMVRMVADECIENWPDRNVPAIFVYHQGNVTGQLIGKAECGLGNVDVLQAALRLFKVPLKHTVGREDDGGDEQDDEDDAPQTRRATKHVPKAQVVRKHADEEW